MRSLLPSNPPDRPRPRWIAWVAAAILAAPIATGCKAAPLDRPVNLGPPDTGPGSVEYARRQFEGTWTLQRLEIADAGGTLRPVNVSATLVCDQFGNMKVSGRVIDTLPDEQRRALLPLVEYSGRVIIDATKKEFRLENVAEASTIDPAFLKAMGTDIVRKYEITDTDLTIRYVTGKGTTSAVTHFKKGA